ncbi:hypothetical protein V6N13_049074 [Hibiscus sabdariffa]|uniref:Uncharacterized protein n=1 Tax=Hibiscus sabdariffa TaxID=183260 RepID=A0ABR2QYY0_9ROSI
MENRYKHQLHWHNPTFFPILCSRPSLKHVKSGPSSPNIGCMGQVKRSNRIVGCPVSNNNNSPSGNGIKYFKLKKLFSGKNLTGTGCRRKQVSVNRRSRPKNGDGKEKSGSINIENMDPPLPVTKRVPERGDKGDGDTLWERRSRGVALKSLQLQHIIQLNKHQ